MIRDEDMTEVLRQRDLLAWALWAFMDGTPDHHIQDETGLPDVDCERIAEGRKMARAIAISRGWEA